MKAYTVSPRLAVPLSDAVATCGWCTPLCSNGSCILHAVAWSACPSLNFHVPSGEWQSSCATMRLKEFMRPKLIMMLMRVWLSVSSAQYLRNAHPNTTKWAQAYVARVLQPGSSARLVCVAVRCIVRRQYAG